MNDKTRTKPESAKGKVNTILIAVCSVITFVGVIMCGYGHAAVSTDLLANGEATIKATGTFNIKYMQEMEPVVCERAPVGTTEQLIDQRDGKSYWVAKLADGKCWMTQNLALDITTEGLTSELSDLNAGGSGSGNYTEREDGVLVWDANSSRYPRDTVVGPVSISDTDANYTAAKSSKLESTYVFAYPTVLSTKSDEKVKSIGALTGVTLQEIDDSWKDTFKYDASTGMSFDPVTKTYDAHYLMGNYYTNGAATAGSAILPTTSTTYAVASSSICPKGWKLPSQVKSGKNDVEILANAYGFSTNARVTTNGITKDIAEPPLYIYRAGSVTTSSNYYRIGQAASFLMSRSGNTKAAWYAFALNKNAITGSSLVTRVAARTVRCVARSE